MPPSRLLTLIIFIHFVTRSSSFRRWRSSSPGIALGTSGVRGGGPLLGNIGSVAAGLELVFPAKGDTEGSLGIFRSGAEGSKATRVSDRFRKGSLTKPYLPRQPHIRISEVKRACLETPRNLALLARHHLLSEIERPWRVCRQTARLVYARHRHPSRRHERLLTRVSHLIMSFPNKIEERRTGRSDVKGIRLLSRILRASSK